MRVIKALLAYIVIFAMGIFLLVNAIRDKIELSKPPLDIATMTEEDLRIGRYVEGDVTELWDEYAKRNEQDTKFGIRYNKGVISHYFAMPLESSENSGEPKFVTLSVGDEELAAAQKMARESVDGNDDAPDTKMHIFGRLRKLRTSAASAFDKYLGKHGFEPEDASVHYVISVGIDERGSTYALVIAITVTAVGLVGGIITLIRGKRRGF